MRTRDQKAASGHVLRLKNQGMTSFLSRRKDVQLNLKSLLDQALLKATEKLAQDEREILMAVLTHLREIERRRLYCDLGYSSLHAYAVKHLRYSDDQAARRINAMRLIKDLPEVAEKVQSGELSLSNASSAQTLAKRLTMPPEKKRELVKKLENKSTREAEREMAAISPQALRRDTIRSASEETIEIRFSAPRELGLNKMVRYLEGACSR